MIDHRKIRQAFRARVLTVEGLDESRFAWENRQFDPDKVPTGTPEEKNAALLWYKETYLKIDESLQASNQIEQTAIMQFDVFTVFGRGTELAEDMQRLIAEKFKPTTSFAADVATNLYVVIDKSAPLTGRDAGSLTNTRNRWYQFPVSIEFRSYVENKLEGEYI